MLNVMQYDAQINAGVMDGRKTRTKSREKYYNCARADFLSGGVCPGSVDKCSSCSIFRLTPVSLDGGDEGDLEGGWVAFMTGGVDRESDEATSGVVARLVDPNSVLSLVTRLFADTDASA